VFPKSNRVQVITRRRLLLHHLKLRLKSILYGIRFRPHSHSEFGKKKKDLVVTILNEKVHSDQVSPLVRCDPPSSENATGNGSLSKDSSELLRKSRGEGGLRQVGSDIFLKEGEDVSHLLPPFQLDLGDVGHSRFPDSTATCMYGRALGF